MRTQITTNHRGFRIIARRTRHGATATIRRGEQIVDRVTGASPIAAIERAHHRITEFYANRRTARRKPDIGTIEEYTEAFRALRLAPNVATMLRAHATAPRRTMTMNELAEAAGYQDHGGVNNQYGRLGRAIGRILNITPLTISNHGKPLWSSVLAKGFWGRDHKWRLCMHPEVAAALRKLNMA